MPYLKWWKTTIKYTQIYLNSNPIFLISSYPTHNWQIYKPNSNQICKFVIRRIKFEDVGNAYSKAFNIISTSLAWSPNKSRRKSGTPGPHRRRSCSRTYTGCIREISDGMLNTSKGEPKCSCDPSITTTASRKHQTPLTLLKAESNREMTNIKKYKIISNLNQNRSKNPRFRK